MLRHLVRSACAGVIAVLVTGLAGAASATAAEPGAERPRWHMWGGGWNWRKQWQHGQMTPRHRHRMQRHWTFMNGQIPARYQNLQNPRKDVDADIKKGQQIYADNCASCHGVEGLGEGEAGNDLYPSPALLAFIVQMPIAVDSYLMWTIAEGGTDFNTEMPAFKDNLNDDEIWQVITYLRNGFALP